MDGKLKRLIREDRSMFKIPVYKGQGKEYTVS